MESEEPQLINYYNELPNYAIVINNLNQEYEELITNYIKLSDRIDPEIKKDKYQFCYVILLFTSVIEFSIIMILI